MRRPTSRPVLFAFWRRALGQPVTDPAALAHLASRHDEDPECGFYRLKMVKGGPWVPARIWLDQPIDPATGQLAGDEIMRAEIDGRPSSRFEGRWLWMRAITADEHAALAIERTRADGVGDAYRASQARIDLTKEFVT